MKLFRMIAISIILIALFVPAIAQSKRIPIGVTLTGRDPVGRSFTYSLKEQLKSSSFFQYTSDNQGFQLLVATADPCLNGTVQLWT